MLLVCVVLFFLKVLILVLFLLHCVNVDNNATFRLRLVFYVNGLGKFGWGVLFVRLVGNGMIGIDMYIVCVFV